MPVRQPAFDGGRMVPHRQAVVQPLLPYEKRLIDVLGCSEDEYRLFAAELRYKLKERDEAYAHIPDIRNTAAETIAIISLVVGLASTAASFLLKPKAPTVGRQREFRTRQLGSRTGTEIFTPSYGFDSLQELAAYGNTVPIIFTRRDETAKTGGVLISPPLVWSRMKSWGSYQVIEVVGIAGQGNMARPELAGIFLGNNALDGIYRTYFDFYWNGGYEVLGEGSRLRMYNLRYGEFTIDDGRGDNDEAFYAATRVGANQAAFSGAFTPNSQTRFGVYSGIPNGTPIRPDWRIFSVLDGWDDKQRDQALTEQRKYVDGYLMVTHPYGNGDLVDGYTTAGMPGTGVNYCRRVGVIEHVNGSTGARTTVTHTLEDTEVSNNQTLEKWGNLTTQIEVNVGDEIVILFGKGRQDSEPFPAVGDHDHRPADLSDVRSTMDSEVQRYDQLLAIGQTFMIGRSTWEVIDRPLDRYDPDVHSNDGYRVRLRCLEAWSRNQRKIGIVDEQAISRNSYLPFSDIEESFYPILKYEIGTFQNTRSCDVTEIGIRSQVWTKFNNLTNFNTLPSPYYMAQSNKDDITLREGKMTLYSRRISLFALDARYSNNTDYTQNTQNEGWTNLGPYLFAVIGNIPVDIYSFIRVTHPSRSQLEYRLRPFNSAIPTQQSSGEEDVFVLDGGKGPFKNWNFDTYLGTFTIGGRGYFAKPRDIFTHPQMAVVPELVFDETGQVNLQYGRFVPDPEKIDVVLESVISLENASSYTVGENIRDNTLSNIMSLFFGEDPYFDNLPVGTRRTKNGWEYTRDPNKTVNMELVVEAYERNYETTPRNKWWRIVNVDVHDFSGNWSDGETFVKYASNLNGVQFGFTYRVTRPTIYQEFDTPQTVTRLFERYSGVAEVSHYGDMITRSCDDQPEHEIIYVNESLAEDRIPQYEGCAVVGLKLKSSDNFTQLDQLRCYMKNGLEVERLLDGDTGPSNLLSDLLWYLITNRDTGVGSIINADLVDRDSLVTTGRYLRANRLFFDDAIAEPVNLRSWLAEVAPSVLCYSTLKNGRLSIEPALPYHDDGVIDTTRPILISAMFTEGNIIEDSLQITWLELENRKLFQAAIIYRISRPNQFPEQKTVIVRYDTPDKGDLAIEEFELNHITSTEHALRVARYFLAVRKHQTHTITFRTLPWGLDLAPGQYIRVASKLSPYNPANNGIIQSDGTVVAASPIADGSFNAYYWDREEQTVSEGQLVISGGVAQNLRNTVFSIQDGNEDSQVYQIEAIDVDQEGIVTIQASNYPVDAENRSVIARDVLDSDNEFEIIGAQQD